MMRMKALLIGTIAVGSSLALCMPAMAQSNVYREGPGTINGTDPDALKVHSKSPKELSAQNSALAAEDIISRFKHVYRQAKQPRIAVFWNREFNDNLSEWYSTIRVKDEISANISGTLMDKNNAAQISASETLSVERRADASKRTGLSELDAAHFESGFVSTLNSVPVKLIDRSTVIRKVGLAETGGTKQSIETKALEGFADYYAELLSIADIAAIGGYAVKLNIINIKTGEIVTSAIVTPSNLQSQGGEWKAAAGGFSYVENVEPYSPKSFGHEVALELMRQMSLRL